jgi:hypothetical protein
MWFTGGMMFFTLTVCIWSFLGFEFIDSYEIPSSSYKRTDRCPFMELLTQASGKFFFHIYSYNLSSFSSGR